MRRSRLSEREIVGVVEQIEAGVPVEESARKCGVSETAMHRRAPSVPPSLFFRAKDSRARRTVVGELPDEQMESSFVRSQRALRITADSTRHGSFLNCTPMG